MAEYFRPIQRAAANGFVATRGPMSSTSTGRGRTKRSGRRRGQSLVEFALLLPVLMVLVLTAVDFGRLFYSWVTLNNSARVAANYAAAHPVGPFTSGSTYAVDVNNEGFAGLNGACTVAGGIPVPTFTDTTVDLNTTTKDFGDLATVSLSCNFRIITPIISTIVGSGVVLSASSTFSIRTGAFVP
jgi:Flp pilus assembly protein TadG